MSNRISLIDNEYIFDIIEGDQTPESVQYLRDENMKLFQLLRSSGKQARILADITRMGNIFTAARKTGFDGVHKDDYDMIAVYGGNIFVKNVANLIVKAAGKQDKVNFFKTREEALGWLLK